jgi:hypothetical protein
VENGKNKEKLIKTIEKWLLENIHKLKYEINFIKNSAYKYERCI